VNYYVVYGYLLFPSKSVLYLASWCAYLSDFFDCWQLLFPFSHFLAIDGDYLLITVDVLWRCGEYVDELNIFYGVASNFVGVASNFVV